jgi:elongation factor 2
LVDNLILAAGLIHEGDAGERREMQTQAEEQARGITIAASGISLVLPHESSSYLVNLVDSPGHVDFSAEVTAALRITDGAIVVVDAVEGAGVQTETVLRQALAERIKPVLHINKVDRAILELQLDAEELYKNLERNVNMINTLLATSGVVATDDAEAEDELSLDPLRGQVSFGSGKQGWAFTLPQVARFIAQRTKKDPDSILRRLWGDHFFDPETKKFLDVPRSASGKTLPRYIVQVFLEPLVQLWKSIMSDDAQKRDSVPAMLEKLGITLSGEKKSLTGSELLKHAMRRWLPASEALTEMIVHHLPSPRAAQKYRAASLYTGPQDDAFAAAIRACDPEGPLVVYISKMIASPDGRRFTCFGRVFSGTARSGQRVSIMAAGYDPNNASSVAKDIHHNRSLQKIVHLMGRRMESADEVPCGNTIGILGIEQYLLKTGTIVDRAGAYPIADMRFSVSPVVRVAVEPKRPSDLPKLIEALRLLSRVDPLIQVTTSSAGEHIVAGGGELHVEVATNTLRNLLRNEIEVVVSNPVVEFRETVSAVSSQVALAKSANSHNRLFIQAEPLGEDLSRAIDERRISVTASQQTDLNERAAALSKEFGWDLNVAKKIWFFGPEDSRQNVFIDGSQGVAYLQEVKDSIGAGFNWATREGPLCDEPMRAVRFTLMDAKLHSDSAHRGTGQITPTARRAIYASTLLAEPRLIEPMFNVEITAPRDAVGGVYSILGRRRSVVYSEELKPGTTNLYVVRAYMPVQESFGFSGDLRAATSGKAFPQMMFDHWKIIEDDPYTAGTLANQLVADIRKRKGLPDALPTADKFYDRL